MEGAYAGMVERTYAGDVTSVRAGLRRRILLRLREPAKQYHTSSTAARTDATSPAETPTARDGSGRLRPVLNCENVAVSA